MKCKNNLEFEIKGYYPGVIGKIVELHAVYYHDNWGFDISFETQVGRELSEFLSRFDSSRDGFWSAVVDGKFVGAIAIDGEPQEGARLRWFIVHPAVQGKGVGRALIEEAIKFCRNVGHRKIYLWTFKGLETARHLYESTGFILAEEHEVDQWGTRIREQKFELSL